MKALVCHGPREVQIDDKPRPIIQHPEDTILHITSTAILVLILPMYSQEMYIYTYIYQLPMLFLFRYGVAFSY
jgi:hypothetical protein